MIGTTERVRQRYHTNLGRSDAVTTAMRPTLFRSFARTVGRWLPADRDAAILDIGCGEGAFLAFLRDRGYRKIAGFDASPENVELCNRDGIDAWCGDALRDTDWARRPGGWQAICCLDVIEHLPKESIGPLFERIAGALAPGGSCVIQVPNMAYVCSPFVRYNDVTHEVGFTEQSLPATLRASGFDRIEVEPAWNATTVKGRCREAYLRMLHRVLYLAEGRGAPRIASKNLLVRAFAEERGEAK